jgi:hypothetical protein
MHLQLASPLCTFDIKDLYTMLAQEESLDILTEFLIQFGYHKVKGIPMKIQCLYQELIKWLKFLYDIKMTRIILLVFSSY